MMASLARVMPKMAGKVGSDPRTDLPCSSLPPSASMGGCSEYTQVIMDVS